MKVILAVMCTTWAVVKTRPEKNSGLYGLFSRITSTHLCIQLHVYPANGFNIHSLSDVKRVVFIYRCEFLKNHKAKYRTMKPIPNYFQPRIKICHTFGIQSLSFNFSWKGRNFMLMAGIEITLIY